MDRDLGRENMDQLKHYEGLAAANQRFSHDPSNNINANVRPPDYGLSNPARPVLNYSIQTGEEFAFEFMKERANLRQQFIPNAYVDPGGMPVYMDLKGLMGFSQPLSESGSEVSMPGVSDKTHTQGSERIGSPQIQDKNRNDALKSVPRSVSGNDMSQGHHSYASSGASDSSSNKVKFLCSFGGKILPRPSDGKLRYVGGETRIIQIKKDISWQDLKQRTLEICVEPHAIKYQLPGEDLDALVSVSCDEDLQNMMEECNMVGNGGSLKPRMFLFSISDLEESQFGMGAVEGDSEIQYVVAVNGMDISSRKNSIGAGSGLANNLEELLSLNVEREADRRPAEQLGGATVLPSAAKVPTLTVQSSQAQAHLSSAELESCSQMAPFGETLPQPPYNLVPVGSLPQIDVKGVSPLSVPLHGGYTPFPFIVASAETSVSSQSHQTQHGGHTIARDEILFGNGTQLRRDGTSFKINEPETVQAVDDTLPTKDPKILREFWAPKVKETGKALKPDKDCAVTINPRNGMLANPAPSEELPSLASDNGSSLPRKSMTKNQNFVQTSVIAGIENDVNKSYLDDRINARTGVSTSGYSSSESEPAIGHVEQPMIAHRIFHSEQIPRDLAEASRLSKSDEALNSQFLSSQESSGHFQPITESADKLNEVDRASHTDQLAPFSEPSHEVSKAVEDGVLRCDMQREPAHVVNNVNSREAVDSSSERLDLQNSLRSVDGQEMAFVKEKSKDRSLNRMDSGLSNTATTSRGNLGNHSRNPLNSNEVENWERVENKNLLANADSNSQPSMSRESSVQAISLGESTTVSGGPEGGDILVDINDRFPRDFLSDIFLKAKDSQDFPGLTPLHGDGTGLSVNMENHEPKSWSYFRDLAQDGFVRKDLSLIDQDHPIFASPMSNAQGTHVDYSYPPLQLNKNALSHMDSPPNFDGSLQPESSMVDPNTIDTHQDYSPSQLKDDESVPIAVNTNMPILDLPSGEFDMSSVQIIKDEDLEELKELGSGTFGTVYHGKWRGTDVAIKRIKKSCFIGRSSEQERLSMEFWREADILSKLHHPNVVAFYGVVRDGPGGTLATVTEFMVNGSLRHVLINKDRQLDHRKRLIIAMDAAFGMEYLHSKNIVHFDLKCDNLLVNLRDPARPICKVGDFGLSKIKRNTLVTGGVRGTLPWMAPELLNGSSSKVSEKVDVFSFGIVLWEILTGDEPYANMHYGRIIGGIVSNTLRPPVPSPCDPEWQLLMEQCWAPDPTARPSFTEIARRLRAMSAACQTKPKGNQGQSQVTK